MFIGHFGVALAAKKIAPRTSLGTLVLAAQFADVLWPVFLLLGIERVVIAPGATIVTPLDFISYPFSHSLLAIFGWACLFAGIYQIVRRDARGAVCVWFVVLSHWVLDALTHRPDLQLYPDSSTYVGLGLWNSRFWTILVEGTIFFLAARRYARSTRPRDWIGTLAFRSFIAVLTLLYLFAIFGPPPPSDKALVFSALGIWLFIFWAYWLDRHRAAIPSSQPPPLTPPGAFPDPTSAP